MNDGTIVQMSEQTARRLTADFIPVLIQIDHLEFRAMAAFLSLFGLATAIWPETVNQAFANSAIERLLWRDPGPLLLWIVRLFSLYWMLVWGWFALFAAAPPYFPT